MTEPREQAKQIQQVADGVWSWRIHNIAIGGAISSSSAVADGNGGCILIDPVGLDQTVLDELPQVNGVVLTARTHQRAAWRYHDELGAKVWMPEGSTDAEGEPDHYYSERSSLPAGLQAIHTPGPQDAHYCLLHALSSTLFVSDLVTADESGHVRVMPGADQLHEDADQTRASVDALTHYSFDNICLAHGAPVIGNGQAVLEAALVETPGQDGQHTTPAGPRNAVRAPALTGAVHSKR